MIKNTTKGTLISKNKKICSDVLSKSIGLMLSKKEFMTLIFVFKKEKIVPLHMFFVFFPIDVIFLDRYKRIVEVKENFRPFAFYTPKNKAKYVIELQEGSIKKYKIEVGDHIMF